MTRPEEILVARAERDLDEGLHYKTELLKRSGHPLLARAMQAAIDGALHAMQLKKRHREDVLLLCALAHRCHAGEDPAALWTAERDRILRMRELALVAHVKDPAFPDLLDRARELFVRRLPDLGRMVTVPDPVDYDDLVRRAFDKAYVVKMVEENRALVLDLIEHVHAHPSLLRVPRAWQAKLREMGRDIVEWQTARVLRGVDEIYASPAS